MTMAGRDARFLAPLLACLLVFAFLAGQLLLQGPVVRVDLTFTQHVAANRSPWLNAFMRGVAEVHRTVPVLAAAALLAAWRTWRRDARGTRLLLVVPAGMLLNLGLKHLFQRARPVLDEPLVNLATYSFPSAHAVASSVLYGAACALVFMHARSRAVRGLAATGAVAMVLLVAASRVYLGAHYLSDVIAGVALGTACVLVAFRLSGR